MRRTEPCACGTPVVADSDDPTPGVAAHNATPHHRFWRSPRSYHRCAGVDGVPCVVTIPVDRALCHFCRGTLRMLRREKAA